MIMRIFDYLFRKTETVDPKTNEVWTIFQDSTNELYFTELAFHIATSYIANTIGKCEFKVYRNGEEVKDEMYYLLNVSPNDNENASQFKNKLISKLFYDNESLIVYDKHKFYVADSFGIEEKPLGKNKFTNIKVGIDSIRSSKTADNVFYFRLDDHNVKALIQTMSDGYDEVLKYAYDSYKTSNSEKYKLELANIKAGDTDFNEKFKTTVKKQLEDFINNPKAVYPQFQGYNLTKLSESDGKTDSSDIQRIRKDVFETVAQAFKMPVSMLYGNITNLKELVNTYITFTIEPIAEMISQELTRKTCTFEEWQRGDCIKVDITSINHTDIFDIADKVDKLISSGIYCVDEIRKKMGENLLNTDFSKQHWMTKNYSTSDDALVGDVKGGE